MGGEISHHEQTVAVRQGLRGDESYPFDLGTYCRADVHATDYMTAVWFNRGLNWMFAFNHEEAIRCFERALELEPDFALAWWGIAHSHGPNYNVHQFNGYYEISNKQGGFPCQKTAFEAIQRAALYKHRVTPAGRALIEALQIRNVWPESKYAHLTIETYSSAMRSVYKEYPNDPDIACLFVESLMQLGPWELFERHSFTPAKQVPELLDVLKKALASSPEHPGLNHLMIHVTEMSSDPAEGLAAAKVLRSCSPDAGHLLHMPSHTDVLVGAYCDAVKTSTNAIKTDFKYVEYANNNGEEFKLYIGYISHDMHMLVYAAMMAGMEGESRANGAALMNFVEDSLKRYPARAIDLDLYHAVFYHVLVRFGKWQDLIEQPFFENDKLYCATNTVLHYTKGLAFAALGNIERAREEQACFERNRKLESVYKRILHNNTAKALFAVNSEMLQGEILYRTGQFGEAFECLERAIALEDDLAYDEPWGQMQPIRHALGALLLEQNQTSEAEKVFRADLKRNPNNPWSLRGLYGCLCSTNSSEASTVKVLLDAALEHADVPITYSCGCAGLPLKSPCSSTSCL